MYAILVGVNAINQYPGCGLLGADAYCLPDDNTAVSESDLAGIPVDFHCRGIFISEADGLNLPVHTNFVDDADELQAVMAAFSEIQRNGSLRFYFRSLSTKEINSPFIVFSDAMAADDSRVLAAADMFDSVLSAVRRTIGVSCVFGVLPLRLAGGWVDLLDYQHILGVGLVVLSGGARQGG